MNLEDWKMTELEKWLAKFITEDMKHRSFLDLSTLTWLLKGECFVHELNGNLEMADRVVI